MDQAVRDAMCYTGSQQTNKHQRKNEEIFTMPLLQNFEIDEEEKNKFSRSRFFRPGHWVPDDAGHTEA